MKAMTILSAVVLVCTGISGAALSFSAAHHGKSKVQATAAFPALADKALIAASAPRHKG